MGNEYKGSVNDLFNLGISLGEQIINSGNIDTMNDVFNIGVIIGDQTINNENKDLKTIAIMPLEQFIEKVDKGIYTKDIGKARIFIDGREVMNVSYEFDEEHDLTLYDNRTRLPVAIMPVEDLQEMGTVMISWRNEVIDNASE